MILADLIGTSWTGHGELWLDRLGNQAETCACTVAIADHVISYDWSYQGAPHHGRLALRADGADFSDSWHSPTAMACTTVAGSWALVEVTGTYAAGDGPPWGWRIAVSHRPSTDQLVLQMTNVKPWGEDGRAVRMICDRG
jgi:hypothetical protein